MTAPLDGRLLMVGCGNMGGAMLRRWLECGLMPAQVTVVSPSGRALPPGVTVLRGLPAESDADVVLLALKPQQLGALAGSPLAGYAPALLVSILAGVDAARLASLSRAVAVVRAMPNLPVALGKGVVMLQSDDADNAARAEAERLMAPLGLVEWSDAARFDALAALSGCGPAFLFRFVDALADAGVALGIEPAQAARLALATVEGGAALAAGEERSPATLADAVASPGGMTRAGLDVLDHDEALRRLLRETLSAAARRGGELAEVSARPG